MEDDFAAFEAADGERHEGTGRGRGRGRGKARGAGRTGAGRGRGNPGLGATGKAPCLVPGCSDLRRANAQFCALHKRSFDSMQYQAEKEAERMREEDDDDDQEDSLEIWNNIKKNEAVLGEEVRKFSIENPPDARYARKSLINWAAYKRSYGQRVTRRDRASDVPMWEGEFQHWGEGTKRLPGAEVRAWWQELLDDPNVERDYKGRGGRLQLYIPNAILARDRLRDRYIDNAQEEGSAPIRNCKPKDIQVLRDHVDRQEVNHAADFLKAPSSSSSQQKRAAPDELAALAPPKKKVALEREVPKLGKAIEKELKTITTEFNKAWSAAEAARDAIISTEMPLTDRASFLYKSTLQFRMQVGARFKGDQDLVIVLGKPRPIETVAPSQSGGDGQVTNQPPKQEAETPISDSPKEEADGRQVGGKDTEQEDEDEPAGPKPKDSVANPEIPKEQGETPAADVVDDKVKQEEDVQVIVPRADAMQQQGTETKASSSSSSPGVFPGSPDKGSEASFKCVFAGNAGDSEYRKEVRAMPTKQLLEKNKKQLPFTGPISNFMLRAEMDQLNARVYYIDEQDDFLESKAQWARSVATAKQFFKELIKAASDMTAHIKSLEVKANNDKQAALRKEQKDELERVKREAAAAAEQIRNAQKKTPVTKASLYQIDLTVDRVPCMKELTADDFLLPNNDTPFILKGSHRAQLYLAGKATSKALTSFASQYKQTKECKECGRAPYPLQPKYGKEEAAEFMSDYIERPLDLATVEGGTAFCEGVWFFGYQPGNEKIAVPHNCAATCKILACGRIHVTLVNVVSLHKYITDNRLENYATIKQLVDTAEGWTENTVDALRAAGVEMLQAQMEPNNVIVIPMGWLIMEKADPSSQLVYGVRKSWMTNTDKSRAAYKIFRDLFAAEGRNITRMDAILKLMDD